MERTTNVSTTRTKKTTVKVNDFVTELQTWVDFTKLELTLAKESRINTENGPYFKSLVRDYKIGLYDEDLDDLGDQIKQMLKNTASYNKM